MSRKPYAPCHAAGRTATCSSPEGALHRKAPPSERALRRKRTQSAKLAPKAGVPVVETPASAGQTEREPVVVIFVPLEGR